MKLSNFPHRTLRPKTLSGLLEGKFKNDGFFFRCEWHILPFENTTGTDDKVVTGTTETDLKEKEGTTGTTGTDMKEEEGTVQDYILLILLLIVIVLTVVIVLVYLKKIKTNNGEQQSMHDVHIEMNAINP